MTDKLKWEQIPQKAPMFLSVPFPRFPSSAIKLLTEAFVYSSTSKALSRCGAFLGPVALVQSWAPRARQTNHAALGLNVTSSATTAEPTSQI